MSEKTEHPPRQLMRVELSPTTILLVVLVVGALWLIGQLWPILVVLVTALMLVGTLNPFVGWLQERHIGRTWALIIVFAGCAAILVIIGLITVPALWEQANELMEHLPALQKELAATLTQYRFTAPLASTIRHFAVGNAAANVDVSSAVAVSMGVLEVLGYGATSVVLAIYFIADQEGMRGALFAVVPRRFHVRLARVMMNLETIVGGYIRGQVITSVAIGVFVFALLAFLRVPNALALAAFAGLTDVIPFVGGLLATTPAALASLSRGTVVATGVLVAMVAYQEVESRLIVPRVYGRALRLPSAAVVVALLIGGKLGGILGALFALPVAAGIRMIIQELRVELPGDDTDDRQLRERDARAERAYARRTAGATAEEAAQVAVTIADKIRSEDAADAKDAAAVPLTEATKDSK